jgi:hypothetical protein
VKLLHANIGELTLENDSVPRLAHPECQATSGFSKRFVNPLFSSLLCIWPRVTSHTVSNCGLYRWIDNHLDVRKQHDVRLSPSRSILDFVN